MCALLSSLINIYFVFCISFINLAFSFFFITTLKNMESTRINWCTILTSMKVKLTLSKISIHNKITRQKQHYIYFLNNKNKTVVHLDNILSRNTFFTYMYLIKIVQKNMYHIYTYVFHSN